MRAFKTGFILALIAALAGLAGCGSSPDNTSAPATPSTNAVNIAEQIRDTANDNIEELGTLIKLPFEPEEVAWKESAMPARTQGSAGSRRLTAVMRFSSDHAKRIVAQAEKHRPPTDVTLNTERWYPSELISQSELTGADTLKAVSYSPVEFLQPPFETGELARVENSDYFVLTVVARQ